MATLNWKNLQDLLCPDCNNPIEYNDIYGKYECQKCEFKISERRMDEILNDMYKPKIRTPIVDEAEENLKKLNEL